MNPKGGMMTSQSKMKNERSTIKSMTGFGRGHESGSVATVDVEISTVNKRQFEARINLPRNLLVLESRIQKVLRKCISRGGINCNIRISSGKNSSQARVIADEAVAAAAVMKIRKMAAVLGLEQNIGAADILQIPGVLQVEQEYFDAEKTWNIMNKAVNAAIAQLETMREREGAALFRDVSKRITMLSAMTGRIRQRVPYILKRYEIQLQKKLREQGFDVATDRHEFIREVAQYAERCDISEELTRLESHFQQADELFSSRKPVGRALDFLCQEILREINTIGSKASDAKVARTVVLFKTELEAIREQVQNIE